MSDDRHSYALEWRGIEPGSECRRCTGSGVLTYGSTSTWSGGAGGQVLTQGVCDACWGSGDASRKWVNLRALREQTRVARARNALRELVVSAPSDPECLTTLAAMLEAIASHRIGAAMLRGAGSRGVVVRELAGALARVLRAAAAPDPAVATK